MALLKTAVTDDWNTRPNPLNPRQGIDSGPRPEGLSKLLGLVGSILNWKFTRKENLVIGNTVFVRSSFKGTIGELPPGLSEYPVFPGVDPQKLKGRSYEALALDIQVTDGGKIKRTWHLEDYAEIVDQILHNRPPANLEVPLITGQPLNEVPQSVFNFYDKILQDITGAGQDEALLAETFAEDWQSRPNGLNRVEGSGPGRQGLKKLLGFFSIIFQDIKFERRRAYVTCDKVFMLGRISGTIKGAPPGAEEIPVFPGIPKEKLIGKSFETIFLDRHIIVDGLIAQSYHIEDWATAAEQMVNGKPAPDFGFDAEYLENVDQLARIRPSF